MKWVWIGLGSILYVGLVGVSLPVVAMVHGDCGLESGAALHACFREKRIVLLVYVSAAIIFYALMFRRFLRR